MSLLSMCMPFVVLVDDDIEFLSVIARALRGAGHTVEVARQGLEALRLVQCEPPDIVVTDILMPECDGIELILALRRDYPKLPILAVSGRPLFGAVDLLEMAAHIGADATLVKPFDIQALTGKIVELVEQGSERRTP